MVDILIAKESFTTTIDGMLYNVVKGHTRVAADHPLARLNADFFEVPSGHIHYGVEQATKAPGEKRGAKK